MNDPEQKNAVEISIGLLAWNEQESIAVTLRSLFQQTLFAELEKRGARCEVIVMANGCTDQTVPLATETLRQLMVLPLFRATTSAQVVDLRPQGKANAWNVFVHEVSSREARCLFVMDADIVFANPETLWNMVRTLFAQPDTAVVVDEPQKDIALKTRKSLLDYFSLATSCMTQRDGAQLTGQLYGIRTECARRIYLPRDLIVEDGFIKALICTDGLTAAPNPSRIVQAKEAAHVFEAYASPAAVLRNQKRQMIGQTMLHLLLDKDLKNVDAGQPLAALLRERDERDPVWLRRMMTDHVQENPHFWQLFPGLLTFRFKRWAKLAGAEKLRCLPAVAAGFCLTLISCWMARRFLERGFKNYWPDTRSPHLNELTEADRSAAPPAMNNLADSTKSSV